MLLWQRKNFSDHGVYIDEKSQAIVCFKNDKPVEPTPSADPTPSDNPAPSVLINHKMIKNACNTFSFMIVCQMLRTNEGFEYSS